MCALDMDEKFWKIFFEVHSNLPRQGPGDNESTKKAFLMLTDLPSKPRILDVGCGSGMQTVELAKLSKVTVEAVDNHVPFLEELRQNAEAEGVGGRIHAVEGSMFDLKYADHSFDAVWSEGAIFIIGFEKGLREWKRLLAPKGYLVVSETTWLKADQPAEVAEELKQFWKQSYLAIATVEENLATAEKAGYRVVGHFVLPSESWWTNYYTPILAKLPALKQKYRGDPKALSVLAMEDVETDVFRRYSDYYGYVFYILQNQTER